jgi:hypothetical protein
VLFDTRRYRELSRDVLGVECFDHIATTRPDIAGFRKTLALYVEAYGLPPAEMWGPIAPPRRWSRAGLVMSLMVLGVLLQRRR